MLNSIFRMKKNYFFSLFFSLFSIVCAAQSINYHAFDFQNSIWEEWYYNYIHERETYNYFTDGDTTINNIVYEKLYISGKNTITFNTGPYPPAWYDFNRLEGYIRENNNKQVYFLRNGWGAESLLYDFNIALGDTIAIPPINVYPLFDRAVVVEIDSIQICSTMRNRYLLEPLGGPLLHPLYWTEGVGSTHGLIPRYESFESGARDVCFSDGNCPPCALILNIAQTEKETTVDLATIHPNPTVSSSFIQIKKPSVWTKINVLNNLGQIILTKEIENQEAIINSEKWSPGIYFVVIEQENEKQILQLIKE